MKKFAWIAGILAVLSSCQEVIDLELKSSDPQYVIEAIVVAGETEHFVKITQSVDFDRTNDFPEVSGAVVILSDDQGNSENLVEDSAGYYSTTAFPAVEGRAYTLTVQHGGNSFEANCAIPIKAVLDTVEFIDNSGFGATGFLMVPIYQDDPNTKNYYAFQYAISGVFEGIAFSAETDLILRDDQVTNGQVSKQPLFEGFPVESGDTVQLIMLGIDAPVYEYYFSKIQNTSPNSGAPANPVSNWNNNALGYFNATNLQFKEVVVP